MKSKILKIFLTEQIYMRSITLDDIEYLREWKNLNKGSFFYKKEISKEEQLTWFKKLDLVSDNYMLIIENEDEKIGCIGVRLFDGFADIYNVILGNNEYKGKHIMTEAIHAIIALCGILFKDLPIRVRVLNRNPAINWYKKIGFIPIEYFEDFTLLNYEIKPLRGKYIIKLEI